MTGAGLVQAANNKLAEIKIKMNFMSNYVMDYWL